MTRFAESIAKLSEDGAFQDYARKYGHTEGPAEWIAALHRGHHELLERYRMTEGERVAQMRAELQMVKRSLEEAQRDLGVQRTRLGDVLGNTPAVEALKVVAVDLRVVLQRVDALTKEPGK